MVASILGFFQETRNRSLFLVENLSTESMVIQTQECTSPMRWHLGHTTWFFEQVLKEYQKGYTFQSEDYLYYFNSYYNRFGKRIRRDRRGATSLPTVPEIMDYRQNIEKQLARLWDEIPDSKRQEMENMVVLGCHHEIQHQELMLMDIKNLLGYEYQPPTPPKPPPPEVETETVMHAFEGGLFQMGRDATAGFTYDNESPQHRCYVNPFQMASACVTVGEYKEFIEDGGYANPLLWLDDGWKEVNQRKWQAPEYWELKDGTWCVATPGALKPATEVAALPVTHVSWYEATAFAKWKGMRLPTEMEWEFLFSQGTSQTKELQQANFLGDLYWGVIPARANLMSEKRKFYNLLGNAWEWTSSDYCPYPGFRSNFEEYNDKWFVNQRVLRGGCHATLKEHMRYTYRNYFYPYERWMFSSFRLAQS